MDRCQIKLEKIPMRTMIIFKKSNNGQNVNKRSHINHLLIFFVLQLWLISNYQPYLSDDMNNNYTLEPISKVSSFFDRAIPLFTPKITPPTNKDIQTLHYWMDDAYQFFSDDPCFVNVGFGRLLNTLNRISSEHDTFEMEIQNYFKQKPQFVTDLLASARQKFPHFRRQELCNFLNSLAHMGICPEDDWMEDWFSCTLSVMIEFSPKDFLEALHALYLLRLTPPSEWMETWFNDSEIHLRMMDPVMAVRTFITLARLKIEPSPSWFQEWRDNVYPLLSILDSKDLFDLSESFCLKSMTDSEDLINKWLSETYSRLNEENTLHHSIRALSSMIYADIQPERSWIDRLYHHITLNVDDLDPSDMIAILYNMALRLEDKNFAEPLLLKVQTYMNTHNLKDGAFKEMSSVRKLWLAHHYFKMIGLPFHIHLNRSIDHFKEWGKESRVQSVPQKQIALLLSQRYPDIQEEFFINIICDCVDIFIPCLNLVIEVDGHSHFLNGHLTPLSALKTLLLEYGGYRVVRVSVDRFKAEGIDYVLGKIVNLLG